MSQVWDRFRDRPLWSSQLAARNVRDQADVVLYLVNASEPPSEAGYVIPEMRVLDWIGKPVVVLLNQLGKPQAAQAEAAELQAWRAQLSDAKHVHSVLPLDAFAIDFRTEPPVVAAAGVPELARGDWRMRMLPVSAPWHAAVCTRSRARVRMLDAALAGAGG